MIFLKTSFCVNPKFPSCRKMHQTTDRQINLSNNNCEFTILYLKKVLNLVNPAFYVCAYFHSLCVSSV